MDEMSGEGFTLSYGQLHERKWQASRRTQDPG